MTRPFNTSISIIGGIPDYQMIFDVLRLLAEGVEPDDVRDVVVVQNRFGIRTEQSRGRFLRAMLRAFERFENADHQTLIRALFRTEKLQAIYPHALFWSMGIGDILFETITKQVFIKAYFAGQVYIRNGDIVAYLRYMRETEPVIRKWSDYTLEKAASKYLTFMKKIEFLKGSQKKAFRPIQFNSKDIIFFIYLIKAVQPEQPDLLKNRYIDYLFMTKDELVAVLKKAVYRNYFDMHYTGSDLKIDLKLKFEELVDVLSRSAQEKI